MRRNGIEPKAVAYLLASHYHPDHAGVAQELRNDGTKLVVAEPQLPYIDELNRFVKAKGGFLPIEVEGSVILKPEESRPFLLGLGIEGEILPTPGHSPDSVSLVLDHGIGLTGDLTHPLLTALDDAACRASWDRLRALGVTVAYPAHGSCINLNQLAG